VSAQTRFGPLVSDRGVTFRLWAPAASEVSVVLDTPIAMSKRDGWFEAHVKDAGPGQYLVLWHNVSGDDGDPNDGSFAFTVAGTPAARAAQAGCPPKAEGEDGDEDGQPVGERPGRCQDRDDRGCAEAGIRRGGNVEQIDQAEAEHARPANDHGGAAAHRGERPEPVRQAGARVGCQWPAVEVIGHRR